MATNKPFEELLGRIFDGAREGLRASIEPDAYAQRRRDFIFHMTDWESDMERLADLVKDPGAEDEGVASDAIVGFLYHVIPHLNAAGRLLLDEVSDPIAACSDQAASTPALAEFKGDEARSGVGS